MDLERLSEIAAIEFADIVAEVFILDINECRILLKEGSLVDVWYSLKLSGRYSYHWERRAIDGKIYRHDNIPHKRWEYVETFPQHFHNGSETIVEKSHLSKIPEEALREFLGFVREKMSTSSGISQRSS